MCEFNRRSEHVAAKRHICDICIRAIPKGESYVNEVSKSPDWDFFTVKMHHDCEAIFWAAYANYGDPWDGLAYEEALGLCIEDGLVEEVEGRWRLRGETRETA